MDDISRAVRMLTAMTIAVGVSTVYTPLWLIRGIFLRKRGKGWPNLLQYILTGVGRETLRWQALLGAQPGPYTRKLNGVEKMLSPSSEMIFIKPAGKVAGNSGFDDSALPVKLSAKEWNKETAAYWYRNKKDTSPMSKRKSSVVLYFHGGAYITLDADDIFMGVTAASNHAKFGQVDVLSVAYRLAPGSKYPSQLYEAYSAFSYLRKQGYTSIVIGGDSAGANLAMTLWRYLDEVKHESKGVNSLLLLSPWLDMNGSKRKGFQAQLSSCAVTATYVDTGFKALQTNNLPKAHDPWISPIKWSTQTMKQLPPIFISHGGEETLVEEGMEFIKKAKHNGVQVEHYWKEGYPHDFQALPWFPYASQELFTAVGQFVRKNKSA